MQGKWRDFILNDYFSLKRHASISEVNILALVAKILHYVSAVILLILHSYQIINGYYRYPRKCPTWFSRIILLMLGSFNVWWTSRKRCSMPTGFVPLGGGLSTLTLIVFMVNPTQSESKNNRLLKKVLNKIGKGGGVSSEMCM